MSALLEVKDLTIRFQSGQRQTLAADNIRFSIGRSESIALVGESGSGKSATALALTKLLPPPPSCQVSGEVLLHGENRTVNILSLPPGQLRKIRGKKIAYVFQEPSTSLNPVFTIGYQIGEALHLHRPEIKNVRAEIVRLLEEVGIHDASSRADAYPHQLSGGMQQRAMIAMALACSPELLVADEPTTALDVTIQAQILDLLKSLKQKRNMGVLLITHNFGIVSKFADRVLVMFRGKIVEEGSTADILKNPSHAYTRALLDCVPKLGDRKQRLTSIDYEQIGR